jgi:hypothetical protein
MRLAVPLPIPIGRPSLRASADAAPGTALLLFVFAAGLAAMGLTSLAFGIACVAEPDPGTECAVLIAAVPLVTLPMAFGLAVVGAGFAGWLVRGIDEDGVESQTETNTHQDGSRTA